MTHLGSILTRCFAFCMLPLLTMTLGCTDFDYLTANQCGNLVVEADVGEDCDGEVGCGDPSSDYACRYICNTTVSSCPQSLGYQCGVDGICRKPKGVFAAQRTTTTETARDLLVGDVNADGCAEVIVTAVRSTTVNAFASDLSKSCIASTQALRTNKPDPQRNPPTPLPRLLPLDADSTSTSQALVSGGTTLFGDGLSLHFATESPTLYPVLFPRAERTAPVIRPITAKLLLTDALVSFEQREDGKSDVVVLYEPQSPPKSFSAAFPAKAEDIAAVAKGDVYAPPGASAPCEEVIIGVRGGDGLDIYQLCTAAGAYQFAPAPTSKILLSGTKVRAKNTRIVVADINGDTIPDVATNGADSKPHVAFGLGDGRFHSTPPPLPPGTMPNNKTSILSDMGATTAAAEGSIFIALEMDPAHPGVEFYGPPCPPYEDNFTSPTCDVISGDCEAQVVDIDGDGDDDVVISEGQGVDLAIHRQNAGVFNVTFMDTVCPPHHLGTGDFDGDGINDVAFFDQARNAAGEKATSLSIAYGNASAGPDAPVSSGIFQNASGLSVVQFGPQGAGALLAVTRGIENGTNKSALGIIEVGNERAVAGPHYLKSGDAGTLAFDSLNIIALATGSFSASQSARDFAIMTLPKPGQTIIPQLWLVQRNGDEGLLSVKSTGPSSAIPCTDGCLLTGVPGQSASSDKLVLLSDKIAVFYEPTDNGFTESARLTLTHSFSPLLSSKPPARDNLRPFVEDIDADGWKDVIVLASDGSLVGLFGTSEGSFVEVELLPAPTCWNQIGCGNYAPAMLNLDADAAFEFVIAGRSLPGVSEGKPIVAYEITGSGDKRKLIALELLTIQEDATTDATKLIPADTDYVNLNAADVDGDGVTDLVVMPNSNYFTVLRGLPVHE